MASDRSGGRIARDGAELPVCDVWWADRHHDAHLRSLLSAAERSRLGSLRSRADQDRFVAGRILLRVVLAARLGEPPHRIPLRATCPVCGSHHHGPLAVPGVNLSLNISHSGDRIGVALCGPHEEADAAVAIGIDIEQTTLQPKQVSALAQIALAAPEHRIWRALPQGHRDAALLRWWTRKESVLKASGWGLAIPPGELEVSGPTEPPAAKRLGDAAARAVGVSLAAIHLYDVEPGEGYVGSVASIGGPVRLAEHQGNDLLERADA